MIGKIINLPTDFSSYAQVGDENGEEYTVHASEISQDAVIGGEFAYKVDIWENGHGNVATLRSEED